MVLDATAQRRLAAFDHDINWHWQCLNRRGATPAEVALYHGLSSLLRHLLVAREEDRCTASIPTSPSTSINTTTGSAPSQMMAPSTVKEEP